MVQFIETKSLMVGKRKRWEGGEIGVFNCYRVWEFPDERVLEIYFITMWILVVLFNYTLRNDEEVDFIYVFYHNQKNFWKPNKQNTHTHDKTISPFLCCVVVVQQICSCAYCIPYPVQVQNSGSLVLPSSPKVHCSYEIFYKLNGVKSIPYFPKVCVSPLNFYERPTLINTVMALFVKPKILFKFLSVLM